MAFEKVDTQGVDFPALERAVLEFWERTAAFECLRAKNRGKPKWSFLDGPITANNPMGVHHAWGRTYKDAFQRYFAMTGHELRYQNGFDCQGLWVEVEVEKELKQKGVKLDSKRDIENLVPGDRFASIDQFVQRCKERVDKYARRQTEQSIRLGYWMDWDREDDWQKPAGERRSYYTMSEENNYTIWAFLKKCFDRGLVYRGYDAMPWCPRCAVGLSEMETKEGYQFVAHCSVFVRFPLRGRPGENLLIWTTTPWTLTSNVAAAVNPQLTYLKVRHRDQLYYVAKGAFTAHRLEEEFKRKEWVEGVPKLKTLEQIFKEKGGFAVEGELSGAEMVGWTYDGPFDGLPAECHPRGYPIEIAEVAWKGYPQVSAGGEKKENQVEAKSARLAHRVVAWAEVGEMEGTGIVHIAPGCGKEDFQLGKEQGLPPVAPLDDEGLFLPGFGELQGKSAIDRATTEWILNHLQQKGVLFASEQYPHSYPHCWRCKTELLFRLVDEWFIKMSWREEIKEVVRQVTFLPESINGMARELDWLTNMGDWMISKKRFWGLALPIWVDEVTGDFDVIGSREDLEARAVEGWDRFDGHTPHRPWIDLVKIRNPKTGNRMSRIRDVGNPWLDAGIVAFSTMKYNTDRAYWEKWYPADLITEAFPGQFRNWFYALLAMSTMMVHRPPFKVLLGHATVHDQYGDEMHKTTGNAIEFMGAAAEGFTIDHNLKPNEKPRLPDGALSFEVVEKEVKDAGVAKRLRVLRATYPPIGADVIRWLYCRHNPAQNINFGPAPANELRAKFVLKLWNTYAFLCNYARADGFDPGAPPVPVAERPDIDRWILSKLQTLIQTARDSFEAFSVQAFCLAAEKFVDDEVSNWYVRRNRDRFWSKKDELNEAQARDKLAVYQTLYTVLTTLTKLIAPVVPFLSETLFQNLVVKQGLGEGSVHHCDFPVVDQTLIDEDLTRDVDEVLRRLVTLGLAARNSVKIKVRQPLAEMVVQPADERERRALAQFADQIGEELNIKQLTVREPSQGALLRPEVKPNMKTLGMKFRERLKAVQEALVAADPAVVAGKVQAGLPIELQCADGPATLEPTDVVVQQRAAEGWAGVADRGTQLVIDTRITEALREEGMARDVVRQVQELRKQADLEMEDRIVIYLHAESAALRRAIEAHRAYICSETLATQWATQPLSGDDVHTANVKIEGEPLTIQLRKI